MTDSQKCKTCGKPVEVLGSICTGCQESESTGSGRALHILFRICAAVIDTVAFVSISALLIKIGAAWYSFLLVFALLLEVGYHLHGSLGKSLFGLSVDTAGRRQFYLREIVGKIASTAIFGIGFLLVFSREGLALHDLIAKTRVRVTKPLTPTLQMWRTVLLLIVAGFAGYFAPRVWTLIRDSDRSGHPGNPLDRVTRQMPSVLTILCYNADGEKEAQGSGFLISSGGVAVTNFHVVAGEFRAEAKLEDGRIYQVIGVKAYDAKRDLAIIRLGRILNGRFEPAVDLPSVTFGRSDDVHVGDRIATISSPEGLADTVSDGLVSAVRTLGDRTFFQISAPISPGSSGSPVLDLDGHVIAVSTAQFSEGQNLNFAIPIQAVIDLEKKENNLTFDEFRIASVNFRDDEDAGQRNITNDRRLGRVTGITGFYVGEVNNLTMGVSSGFGIIARENGDHYLQGCMGVRAPLYGSGPLEGSRRGSSLEFEVTSSTFRILFDGKIHEEEISGSYIALPNGGSVQKGEFHLQKRRADHSELSDSCPTDDDMNSKD